jgi:hypothetical protein
MIQNLKFSLSVQVNQSDSDIDYTVTSGARTWQDNGLDWYEWEYTSTQVLVVNVTMFKKLDNQSHIIISNLKVNGINIDNIEQTGRYIRKDTNQVVKGTYGYMSWPGSYTFKIRYAPQVHNYITYLTKLALQ